MELSQWLSDLIAGLSFGLFWAPLFAGFIVLVIIFVIGLFRSDRLKKEYIDSLDDHDKAVIFKYRNCYDFANVGLFKRKDNKVKNRNEAPIDNKH